MPHSPGCTESLVRAEPPGNTLSGVGSTQKFERPCENLIVFVVDASESMGSEIQVRMKAAKGAALAILRKAYQSRSEVALVVVGGEKAGIVLPPTSSVEVAPARPRAIAGQAYADGPWQGWQTLSVPPYSRHHFRRRGQCASGAWRKK